MRHDARRVPGECHSVGTTGLATDAPSDNLTAMSDQQRVREHLESIGYASASDTLFTATFGVDDDRTQVIWIDVAARLVLASPIAEVGDVLPEWLAGQDFGRYTLAAHPPFATVGLTLPLTVSEELFDREAALLAQYADAWEKALTPDSDLL
jgi:hypothetical protein